MPKVLLITDYRNNFYSSTKFPGAGFDLKKISKHFSDFGMDLSVKRFYEIDFRNNDYSGVFVIYQTSEDPGLYYKDYIEDILLGLLYSGATLIPDFKFFRAHHNKVFMEILRDQSDDMAIKNITSKSFGSFEDYRDSKIKYDRAVLKAANTSKSREVYLLNNNIKDINFIRKVSKTFSIQNFKYLYWSVVKFKKHLPISNYRKKFIIQNFISNINGDYRVIVYGDKYYALYRENRDDDFRASGSMKFNLEAVLPKGLLDYASNVYKNINVPYIALDVAVNNGIFYLFEFQALSFGQYTFEKSQGYYSLKDDMWVFINERPDLELEFTRSIFNFINKISICVL